ncbi:MAG: PIN domain-containing protein [Eubacteriales bacterium]|nr:PIN domain-containing protein [Eubacteriales bacterium]
MNEKLKVYLDTSVISYLKQDDSPEKTKITNDLWEKFKTGIYDICFSNLTLLEVGRCFDEKRLFLANKLNEIEYEEYKVNERTKNLATQIIRIGILTEKSFDDCQHIAVALQNDCDIIVSWNFKHLVNVKTINGIRAISMIEGYKTINIFDPLTLLEMEV